MNLIIGGAYQGKRDFARDSLNIPEREMFTCTDENIATLWSSAAWYLEKKLHTLSANTRYTYC